MARPDTNASARKRTDVALAAIAAFDPQVRAFSDIRSVDARSEADDLDRLPATERGVLNGVTVAIKEVFDVAGCRCSWGTPIHANRIPKVDCDVVARIKSAGGIVLGTAASTEYAMARPAPTGNPYALERTPGASSSGSAAAVAARFVDLAIGSQTIGSGIRPAGYCGVLGLKPTHGAISLRGAMPLSGPLDHAVIMAREVGLVEAAFGVLTGGTTSASPTEAVEGAPRIALLKPWFSEPVDPGAWQLVAEVVQQITGGSAQSVTVPDAVASGEQACLETILAADMWRNHHTDAQLAGHVMSSALRAWLERGQRVGDDDYRAALSRKAEYSQTVWDAFAGFDVIATVATTGVAPLRRDGTGSRAPQRLWSLIGCPSIAVPIGLVEGLPIAVQLVARPHEEAALFAASRSIVSQFTVPPPSLSFGAVSLRPDPGPAPLPEPLEVSRSLSD